MSRNESSAIESGDASADFDRSWLHSTSNPESHNTQSIVHVADLFSGCGAMSLGVMEACRALQLRFEPRLAIENSAQRAAAYKSNFPTSKVQPSRVETHLDGTVGGKMTASERRLRRTIGRIDLLVGGPPCQGHSDLNNRTRRSDPRNELFFKMVRSAEVLEPDHLVIENVPGVKHDRDGVLTRSVQALEKTGYRVQVVTLHAENVGVPQRRRRTFVVATIRRIEPFTEQDFAVPQRTFEWACSDLMTSEDSFNKPATPSRVNLERIAYLFQNGLHDLPDSERPPCHRDKMHTYGSVYGRLRGDQPAQTITTGYRCMGQGRYVHPTQPRTLTAHEAARLQFIPDFFRFGDASSTALAEMIGNAVPPKLSYVLALHLLR